MTLAEALTTLQSNKADLAAQGIASIAIFGSVARGQARPDSDIDLLVTPCDGVVVGGLQMVKWKLLLTKLLGRKTDVVVEEFLDDRVRENMQQDLVVVFLDHD